MFLLAKYNTQTTFTFPIIKRAAVDFALTGDWTPATGDTKISSNNGSVGNTTNNPAAVAGAGSALWSLTLTAAELSAAVIVVQIVDAVTKTIEDQCLIIYTYGNASAAIPLDLSINQTGDSFARLGTTGSGLTSLATQASVDAVDNFIDTEIADIQARLPAALVSGRIDASVGAMAADVLTAAVLAADSIDDAALAADMDSYQMKIALDVKTALDRYLVVFHKNSAPITSGITSPTIRVIKASEGSDLISTVALTQIAATGYYKRDESSNRVLTTDSYIAIVTATIDGASRSWVQPIATGS